MSVAEIVLCNKSVVVGFARPETSILYLPKSCNMTVTDNSLCLEVSVSGLVYLLHSLTSPSAHRNEPSSSEISNKKKLCCETDIHAFSCSLWNIHWDKTLFERVLGDLMRHLRYVKTTYALFMYACSNTNCKWCLPSFVSPSSCTVLLLWCFLQNWMYYGMFLRVGQNSIILLATLWWIVAEWQNGDIV